MSNEVYLGIMGPVCPYHGYQGTRVSYGAKKRAKCGCKWLWKTDDDGRPVLRAYPPKGAIKKEKGNNG